MKWVVAGIAASLLANPASAEVVSASTNGFVIRHSVSLSVAPGAAFSAIGQVARWWDPAHTYGGNAANLSLPLAPGACFCERLPGGGIEHLRVSYIEPGKQLVMTGALGPLLYEAIAGVMDWKVDPAPDGSRVTVTYKAAGFAAGGADKLAPLVDQVLGSQVQRYAAFAGVRR